MFDPHGRASLAFSRWSPLRHSQDRPRTLCERRIACFQNSRLCDYVRIQVIPLATVCVRAINWDAVMLAGVMAACFAGGMTVAGLVLLGKVGR